MRFVLAILLSVCAFAGSPARIFEAAPIRFEPHSGGWVARGLNQAIRFDDRGATLRLGDRTVGLTFPGSSRHAKLAGADPQVASNYFIGKSYESVAAFRKLRRTGVYPGVDVVYYGNGGELEYDFEIAPGANPSAIRMRFAGADRVELNQRGEIVLTLGDGQILQRKPVVYQRRASGEIVSIASSYRLAKNGDVRVELGDYDRTRALVVDPSVTYSAFLYGSGTDVGLAIAHDNSGNIYLAGNTWSLDFPITADAYQSTNYTNQDLWIMKLNPSLGSGAIVYCTYLGGSAVEAVKAMTVDTNGVIYLTGSTNSGGFPVTSNAYLGTITSNSHGFMSILDPSQAGTAGLTYSTFIGGANFEESDAIAIANGKVYVTGFTTSDDFPTVLPTQSGRVAGYDAFVSEYDPTQSGSASLVFSTYLGGSGQDLPHAIAVDAAGSIYVAGLTYSNDFPTTPISFKPFYGNGNGVGDGDGFLTVLNPALGTISYSTYLGGTFEDDIKKIVVEPNGHVALAGLTLSPDFPTSQGAYQTNFKGACDSLGCVGTAFLTILDLKATTPLVEGLVYSTYFGGSGGDVALDLDRDAAGRYVLAGYTLSLDFPISSNAISPASTGAGPDGFIAVIDPNQPPSSPQQLVYSSYFTSAGSQVIYSIDIDPSGTIWATGFSTSNPFPNGAQNPSVGKMSGIVFSMTLQ